MPPAHRKRDPLAAYTFRVKWDNTYIPHITQVGPLLRLVTPVEYRDGSHPDQVHIEPGKVTWPPIVIERILSANSVFFDWSNLVAGRAAPGPLVPVKKTVTIEVYTARGKLALRYLVHRCWPQAYDPVGVLGPSPRRHISETLTLAHEGWERDLTVAFPT